MMVRKGDLVRFEYVTTHHNGVGWEFIKDVGVVIDHNPENDSYRILTKKGDVVERLDMQVEVISESPV